MPAIRYHRFSSKRQDRGSSLGRQDEATRALCESQNWAILETLEDKGQSAWKGDHLTSGELGKLRKRIDAGLVQPGTIVVVENLDRLSRQDYRTARRWIEDVTDRGIIVAVCNPALELNADAMSGANIGAILQHLLEANRASGESARKSVFQRKNLDRMTDMIRAGICPTPRVPAWLKGVVGQPLSTIAKRAAVVNIIFEWSAAGLGLQAICQRLNADYEPWTGPGWKTSVQQWRIGYVRDILRSPAVEGKYVVNGPGRKPTGEVIANYYPRIVNTDLVLRARAGMASRRGSGGANRGEALNYFAGLMTCAKCSGSVGRVLGGRGYAYMTCRNSRYGTCHNKAGMPYETLSKVVVDYLLYLALDDTHFAVVEDLAPKIACASAEKARIDGLRTEQNNLLQVLRKLPSSIAVVNELGRIEPELQAAEAGLAKIESEILEARGAVSPEEHLRRVKAVRDSLDTDAEARRMVREALPVLIKSMKWDGESVRISSNHFDLQIGRDGAISGFDLFHPRAGYASYPEYGRRRDEARAAGTFLPLNES